MDPKEVVDRLQALERLVDLLEKRIHRFLKVYPQITMPEAGAVDVPRDVDLPVQVNSSSRINNTHEVVIVAEGTEDVVLIGPFPVQFMVAGKNPGTARFPAASMSMLAANTEYLILCRRVGGGSSSFVPTSCPFRTKA